MEMVGWMVISECGAVLHDLASLAEAHIDLGGISYCTSIGQKQGHVLNMRKKQ
jgi:hypothetical protein